MHDATISYCVRMPREARRRRRNQGSSHLYILLVFHFLILALFVRFTNACHFFVVYVWFCEFSLISGCGKDRFYRSLSLSNRFMGHGPGPLQAIDPPIKTDLYRPLAGRFMGHRLTPIPAKNRFTALQKSIFNDRSVRGSLYRSSGHRPGTSLTYYEHRKK